MPATYFFISYCLRRSSHVMSSDAVRLATAAAAAAAEAIAAETAAERWLPLWAGDGSLRSCMQSEMYRHPLARAL